jgi:phosphotriesterase-related protein
MPPLSRREVLGMLAALPQLAAAAQPAFPKGAIVRTVLKDYPPEDLAGGATLFHEHLSLAPDFMPRWIAYARGAAAPQTPPPSAAPFFMQDADLMTDELSQAKAEGIACIVDAGHPDMGRDIDFLRQISRSSGLPIVAGAGFYSQPFYPREISAWSENQIFDALIRQVNAAPIGALGEIGSWDYITAPERKVFRAVGRAHAATNLPIFTHTGIPGKSALEQLDLLEDAGVDPKRVAIGHLGNLVDPKVDVHKAICRRGAFAGFDRQGGPGDAQQVPMVMALLEAGFAENLLFSADLSSRAQTYHGGGAGYARALTVFVPKLKAAGAGDDVLHTIMVDNPRRFLAFVPKKA